MADFPYNASYKNRDYTVVSRSATSVTLRPIAGPDESEDSLFEQYWKEFISADIPSHAEPISLRLECVPPIVQRVDAYSPYEIAYPTVALVIGDKIVDVTKYVTAGKPNTQTPGLYIIQYRLPMPGIEDRVIWQSYLSIEEPPVLRHIITPWNRDSYTIANLTRLVLEPQFQEALYEEGSPLYNFVTANMSPALRPQAASKFAQCVGYKSGNCIFISGGRLPLATTISLYNDAFAVRLDRAVAALAWAPGSYAEGSIVEYNKKAYCATAECTAQDIPGSSPSWVYGGFYSLQKDPISDPRWAEVAPGKLALASVWTLVDLRGYIFQVDVRNAPVLSTYWGYYSEKYFKDYRPGDIITYIQDGVLYLYRRNDTDIKDDALESIYNPGNYKNPHWDEVYASYEGRLLRKSWVKPITNAGNAVLSKTCSLSEEVCAAYAYMMGIPDSIVDAIGSKCSVFMYILLQRTRNTYEGFRNAFRAIGLDVSDLHRVYPTVKYENGQGQELSSVYDAASALKKLSEALKYDLLWQDENDPPALEDVYPEDTCREIRDKGLGFIRYAPSPREAGPYNGRTYWEIQMRIGNVWEPVYRMTSFGDQPLTPTAEPGIQGNNRYYKASLALLERLASDALIDMGDGMQWIDIKSFSPISAWISDVLAYEVPMYIYLTLTVKLASVDAYTRSGIGQRRLHMAAYGGTPVLIVHPSMQFDLASMMTKEILASVEVLNNGTWESVEPRAMRNGSAVYEFDAAVTVRFTYPGVEFEGYWSSRHTNGILGDNGVDASEVEPGTPLYLCNGIAAVTPILPLGTVSGTASYLKYNYVMSESGTPWSLDYDTPFGGYSAAEPCPVYSTWAGDMGAFRHAIDHVTDGSGADLQYVAELSGGDVEVSIYGLYPEGIYIYDNRNVLLALIVPPRMPHKAIGHDEAAMKFRLHKD